MSKINNDAYYTPVDVANWCWDITASVLDMGMVTDVIEPSVGTGSFCHHSTYTVNTGYDITPMCSSSTTQIITADFLKTDIKYTPGRLIIGNPPYGERNNLSRQFFIKSCGIADWVGFILPINQLNNTLSLYHFDLISSNDLGIQVYSNHPLHCCFNIYQRPSAGRLNPKPITKLQDVTITRYDAPGYSTTPYDLRMCYWGNSTAGKILADGESYSAEYKIKVNRDEIRDDVMEVLANHDWKSNKSITMRTIPKAEIIQVLKEKINNIN